MSTKQTNNGPERDAVKRAAILSWARAGIYPPPYAGNPRDPETVQFALAHTERWSDPPPLDCSDEEAVQRQMQAFQEKVARGLALTDRPADAASGAVNCSKR